MDYHNILTSLMVNMQILDLKFQLRNSLKLLYSIQFSQMLKMNLNINSNQL
ncbi:hypothetical protein TVAGG3_0479390 [Trichomonas vaginalis G3]|uniref:hypothetical protein n=1 Tax=Trichomonas vaginalis (strain ATCC PRA-98 / G3) TaxID=412133 RepID=UPI0021E58774|nr:hypothetical protein TVAGG3_0479390 [Trichomonas vaginalis G3]KAI5515588.1 hypothetical protein TVAGG3_0479390 [Trichomonas vaginalis G3]